MNWHRFFHWFTADWAYKTKKYIFSSVTDRTCKVCGRRQSSAESMFGSTPWVDV